MSRITHLALLPLALTACAATKLYTVADAPTPMTKGIVYVLPKTLLLVETEVETVKIDLGPYAVYNEALGFPPATATAGVKHSFKTARVTPVVVPDPAARFVITPAQNGNLIDRGVSLVLTDEGYTTGSDASFTDRRADFAIATIGAVSSVASSALGFMSMGATKALTPSAKAVDEDKASAPIAACVEDLKPVGPGNPRPACTAAARLMHLITLRDRMVSTTKADVPADAFAAQLAATNAEIDALRKLFFATVTTKTTTWRYHVEPGGDQCMTLGADGEVSEPSPACPAGVGTLKIASPTKAVNVPACKAEGEGLVYRLPHEDAYTATVGALQLAHGRALFPQLGSCVSAPNAVKGRKGKLVVTLSRTSGMLTSFAFEAVRDYSDIPKAVGDGLASILDSGKAAAEKKRELAKEAEEEATAAADPVLLKQRELELLRLEREVACFRELGGPCPDGAATE